ncbi:phBC6A51 family helix-turn-helix protein [Vagococcus vulneris]|uniref:Homeodomain phBC6A51-type domain-containing protein n=1 Tax=Vagococcus vulneris TaxID=1977869 RepID=A0A430A199_9ENTE|nr:phBC6A51 family helix-turn-helix protein [Vagococcus vulneris]RSU00109.1 hypothetical protein CBF37_02075 [Vagococcus vulneris]
MAKDLTTQQLDAITFLVAKDFYGMTDKQIAEKVGICPATLYKWKKLPEFNDELVNQARELNRATLADVYSFIRKTLNNPRAKEGTKVKLSELVMKSQGEFRDVIDQNITVNDERSLDEIFDDLGVK